VRSHRSDNDELGAERNIEILVRLVLEVSNNADFAFLTQLPISRFSKAMDNTIFIRRQTRMGD
jgi:hypothetical protein